MKKLQPLKILLVDDDPATCFLISRILSRQGHTVEAAENGKQAINAFTVCRACFDVIITDHNMPLISGLELVQYLRKNEFAGRIIVISGVLTNELLVAYQSKRVDKIMQKPFTVEEIAHTLNETLQSWQSIPETALPA